MKRSKNNGERLTEDELKFIYERAEAAQPECPDCGCGHLCAGPTGGMSINRQCNNPTCGSRFNDMGPLGWDRISDPMPDRPNFAEGPYR